MKSSVRLDLAIGAVLVVSLGGKLAASSPSPGTDPIAAAATVGRMLQQAGFDARVTETSRSPRAFVEATGGDCRIIAGEYPPQSTLLDVYRDLAAPVGRLRFAHRGRLHDQEPKVLGLFDSYLWRELRRIGIRTPRKPVIAVAASPGCTIENLPWTEVAALPR